MKAVVLAAFGGAENFEDKDLPLPDARPGDLRIRVKAASFNPVDYQIRRGGPEGRRVHSMILGRDLSGVVDAFGPGVSGFAPGDEVFSYVCALGSSGTYAEYVSVPAELVARKPKSLTHAQAAAVPVAGITASLALGKAAAGAPRSLFIAGGSGGVGSFAIMLARAWGVTRLVTTAGSPASRAHLTGTCGLRDDQVVDYRREGFIDRSIEANGGAFESVVDLVGGAMLHACCALVCIEGNLASIVDAPAAADFDLLFDKNASFHPVGANAYSLTEDRTSWLRYRRMLEDLARAFDGGALPAPRVEVVGALSAATVRLAHERLEKGRVQGKLVMAC